MMKKGLFIVMGLLFLLVILLSLGFMNSNKNLESATGSGTGVFEMSPTSGPFSALADVWKNLFTTELTITGAGIEIFESDVNKEISEETKED